MTFQASFNCLWCGRPYQTRSGQDIEGFALLCPDCVGRAQDNEFLRFRLRQGLEARAAASRASDPDEEMRRYYAARAPEYDEVYTRQDPLIKLAWDADLDQATLWLDRLPLEGEIVELAAGTGWWSPLLAQKGELWLYDINEEPLEMARERLLAHGLRAHIHVRDAWAEPDRRVDALFTGFWLGHVGRARLGDFLDLCRRWLKPGGRFALIDDQPDPAYTPTADDMQLRRLADGREFTIPKVYYAPEEVDEAMRRAGFAGVKVETTSRFFLLGQAKAPGE